MSLVVHFAFIGEGTSDEGLIPHLIELCGLCGADDAFNIQLDWNQYREKVGHSVEAKIRAALSQAQNADLLFIHRDADGPDPTTRYSEIAEAIESLGVSIDYVAVVPIQETEAWLLLDEEAIRDVAKKSKGRMRLNLPSPKQVENIAKPKERLKELLATASGLKGRRLKNFNKKFPQHRRKLLQALDCSGPVSEVPAFKRLVDEIAQAIEKLKR
jgi:hypothetical protein